jgi:hypothetical protein
MRYDQRIIPRPVAISTTPKSFYQHAADLLGNTNNRTATIKENTPSESSPEMAMSLFLKSRASRKEMTAENTSSTAMTYKRIFQLTSAAAKEQ